MSLGKGEIIVGDKVFPVDDFRIVPYNPDGDPSKSWQPPEPNTTDGDE